MAREVVQVAPAQRRRGTDGAAEQQQGAAEHDAAVDVRPQREQREGEQDPAVGAAGIARQQPHECREERQREGLRARRRRHLDEDQRGRHGGDPERRAAEAARREHRDAERADEARDVGEVDERQPAEVEEAVRGQMGQPLLVLPRLAGGERRQAVGMRQAGTGDVAARREPEPGVRRHPRRRDRQQAEREQQRRQRQHRVGDRAFHDAREPCQRMRRAGASGRARSYRRHRHDALRN